MPIARTVRHLGRNSSVWPAAARRRQRFDRPAIQVGLDPVNPNRNQIGRAMIRRHLWAPARRSIEPCSAYFTEAGHPSHGKAAGEFSRRRRRISGWGSSQSAATQRMFTTRDGSPGNRLADLYRPVSHRAEHRQHHRADGPPWQLSELWFREDNQAGEKDLLLRGRAGLSGKAGAR